MATLSDDSGDDEEMVCVDTRGQIIELRCVLEEMMNQNNLGDAPTTLQKLSRVQVTKEIIETTNIGLTINKLRKLTKETNKSLSEKARQLILNWRKLIPVEKEKEEPQKEIKYKKLVIVEEELEDAKESSSSSEYEEPEIPSRSSSSRVNITDPIPPTSKTLIIRVEREIKSTPTTNLKRKRKTKEPQKPLQEEIDWRERARKMIFKRIEEKHYDLSYRKDRKHAEELTKDLEQEIFELYGSSRDDYNECVRSKTFNISDPKNPKLREKFLRGIISPQQLAKMTTFEMASDELKEKRSQWWKEGIQDSQLAVQQSNKASLLKCSRCGKRDVYYFQLQTRSADEPMTTFANCNSCGHRWKF